MKRSRPVGRSIFTVRTLIDEGLEGSASMTDNCHVNSLLLEDASVHRWYRSVLAFPPHLVRRLLSKFAADETSLVLDPFCGTGTTPVECKKSGVPSIGMDFNHMAYFASRTKVSWDVDLEAFLADSIEVSEAAAARIDCRERPAVANSCARAEKARPAAPSET